MKKALLLLPGALFPYGLLFSLYCVFTGFLMETVFSGNIFVLLFYLLVFFIVALIGNVIFLILSAVRKWDSSPVSFMNMLIKLIQIPAYIAIFVLGLLFLLTIFTFGFSIFFVIFDCLTIFLTGLTGVAAVSRCYSEGKIPKTASIILGIFQFVFCIDVVCAIIVCVKSKSNPIQRRHLTL